MNDNRYSCINGGSREGCMGGSMDEGRVTFRVVLRRGTEVIYYSRAVHSRLEEAVAELKRAAAQPSGNLTSLWVEADGVEVDLESVWGET